MAWPNVPPERAFCLPLNVVQSVAVKVPVADPEAAGKVKVRVPLERVNA